MSDEMVTIATFGDPIEAQVFKNRLEEAGITAFITGGESGGLFAGMGGAFGLVRLVVAEKDQEQALAILDETPEEDLPDEPETEPATAIRPAAWKGESSEKDDSEPEARVQAAPGIKEAGGPAGGLAQGKAAEVKGADEDDMDAPRLDWGAEDYAARAWKAAVLGVLVVPPLLHFYSIWCIIRLYSIDEELSPAGRRKLYGALMIDILAVTVLPLLLCGGALNWFGRWHLTTPPPPPPRYRAASANCLEDQRWLASQTASACQPARTDRQQAPANRQRRIISNENLLCGGVRAFGRVSQPRSLCS
jgi:hypothetical protein